MAHITYFSIDRLAGRSAAYARSLNAETNIFFGANGSGKTSLLKVFHSALSGDISHLKNVPFSRAEVHISTINRRDYVRVFDRNKPHRVGTEELEGPSFRASRGGREGWKTLPEDDSFDGSWKHTYLATSRLLGGAVSRGVFGTLGGLARNDNSLDEAIDSQFADLLRRLWSGYYAEMSRKVQTAQERGLASILTQIVAGPQFPEGRPDADFDTVYHRVSQFLSRQEGEASLGSRDTFKQRYDADRQLRNVVDDLSMVEHHVERAMAPRNRLQSLVNRLFTNKRISFDADGVGIHGADGDDVSIPLSSLSSGEKQILRLLIETLTSHRNPTIIDEPELSLHVDWQHELVEDLRDLKPDSQLILATHSPEIMAHCPDDMIFKL